MKLDVYLALQIVVRRLSLCLTTLWNVSGWMTLLAVLSMDDFVSRRWFGFCRSYWPLASWFYLSACLSVMLCIAAKRYILQQVSEQVNRKCPPRSSLPWPSAIKFPTQYEDNAYITWHSLCSHDVRSQSKFPLHQQLVWFYCVIVIAASFTSRQHTMLCLFSLLLLLFV